MASRYWVGGSGNWSDTAHWSLTSGGVGGETAPTTVQDVFIDANSGASPVITINATASCQDLNFTGAITPTLAGAGFNLIITGSLTRIAAMTWTFSGTTSFTSGTTGKTITSAGGSYPCSFDFSGVGGGWTLQDAFTTSLNITLSNGSLNTNGKTVTCGSFNCNNANVRTLTLGASTVNCSVNFLFTTTTNLTFNAGTSIINMTGSGNTFAGGGLTFNSLVITGPLIIMTGNNTFASLTVNVGKTLRFTSGTTQTITSLICNGTTASPSTLQSVTAGSPATIALPAGRYFIRHTSIKDITISGATSVTSIAGTNVSGNTGITFVTKFEIGRIKNDGSFNWYNSTTGTVTKVSG